MRTKILLEECSPLSLSCRSSWYKKCFSMIKPSYLRRLPGPSFCGLWRLPVIWLFLAFSGDLPTWCFLQCDSFFVKCNASTVGSESTIKTNTKAASVHLHNLSIQHKCPKIIRVDVLWRDNSVFSYKRATRGFYDKILIDRVPNYIHCRVNHPA